VQTHWFYTVWPFIGVGGAIVMVAILLTTDTSVGTPRYRAGVIQRGWRGSRCRSTGSISSRSTACR